MSLFKISKLVLILIVSTCLLISCSDGSDNSDTPISSVPENFEPPKADVPADVPSTSLSPLTTANIKAMKSGWNLGNTLDAHNADTFVGEPKDTETCWGMPKTTEDMIKGLSESGIKTVRLPVSWTPHIDENYKIDSAWLSRVKTIVDWCLKYKMYVIVNIHHDNYINENISRSSQGFYPNSKAYAASTMFVTSVWSRVASYFKDYNECLIFETLNEPRLRNNNHEWSYVENCTVCNDCMDTLNKLNQDAVDTIRASGGYNETRLIMVPSIAASPDAAFNKDFKMPSDSSNHLALSVHMYTPYSFAMQNEGGHKNFTNEDKGTLNYYFNTLKNNFVSKGYPVIIGECGATNKNNKKDRIEWFKYFYSNAYAGGMIPVLWDNGLETNPENPSEAYGFYNRNTCKWFDNDIKNAAVNSVAGD